MPDLQNFSIVRLSAVQMTVPRWSVSVQVVHSRTGALIRDFAGANALVFPNILAQFSAAQQDEIVEALVLKLIEKRLENV